MKILAIDRQLEDYLRIPMSEKKSEKLFDRLVRRYNVFFDDYGQAKDILEAILEAQKRAKVKYKND